MMLENYRHNCTQNMNLSVYMCIVILCVVARLIPTWEDASTSDTESHFKL